MKPLLSYTKPISREQASHLRSLLERRGFEMIQKEWTLFAANGPKVSVAVYEKGPKVLVQGKGTEEFVKFILEPEILGVAELGYEEQNNPAMFEPHFGIDESGKGDFFGPLVVAGTYVDAEIARSLMAAGVMDSKRISSDKRVRELAAIIRNTPRLSHYVLCLPPLKYNEMYGRIRTLNYLLAWAHAEVITVLRRYEPRCPRSLSDQFAHEKVLQRALSVRKLDIVLEQRTKGESDIAVAAASILARERFIDWMDECSRRLGFPLPKGASAAVKTAAKRLIAEHGQDALGKAAKMHFKTAREVLGLPPLDEPPEGEMVP